jgi:hypothetical protein
MMMEKIISGDVNGSSSCIADVSVKMRRPQKPVEVTHRKSYAVLDTYPTFF